jgi:CheY-like chemotaxis protein
VTTSTTTSFPPILLVEDSEDDVFFMQRAVKAAGIPNPLHVVIDGSEALDYLQRRNAYAEAGKAPRPGLILLDLKLPRLRGMDVLKWIREQKDLATIPIIVLTSSNQGHDLEAAYALGANSFLMKPSDVGKLTKMMMSLKSYWLEHDQFHSKGSRGLK